MISCVLLSAGLSKRFGSPKALAQIGDKTVIGHLQNIFISSKVEEIIIVLGDSAEQIKPLILNHNKLKVVYNKDYILGQTSSFKTGLAAVSENISGIMLQPIDVPLVQTATVDLIIHQFEKNLPEILIPTHKGRKGHPPVFHAKNKKALLALSDAAGLNEFEHAHHTEIELLDVSDPGILYSFNTQEEFEEIRKRFESAG